MTQTNLQQIADQCRVVHALAVTLAEVHDDYARIFAAGGAGPADIADLVGARTAHFMEVLGEMLNGMDAAADDIDWMAPIFAEAQRLWPSDAKVSA